MLTALSLSRIEDVGNWNVLIVDDVYCTYGTYSYFLHFLVISYSRYTARAEDLLIPGRLGCPLIVYFFNTVLGRKIAN